MRKVVLALFSSILIAGCGHARLSTPPTAMPKLPCSVVFEDKDEDSGQEYVGLICAKEGLVKMIKEYYVIDAWQKDAWQKCGPKDGKAQK